MLLTLIGCTIFIFILSQLGFTSAPWRGLAATAILIAICIQYDPAMALFDSIAGVAVFCGVWLIAYRLMSWLDVGHRVKWFAVERGGVWAMGLAVAA